jgi:hypothetical protein
MRFANANKLHRKSGERSRGICSAPRLPHKSLRSVSSHTDSEGLGVNFDDDCERRRRGTRSSITGRGTSLCSKINGTASLIPLIWTAPGDASMMRSL